VSDGNERLEAGLVLFEEDRDRVDAIRGGLPVCVSGSWGVFASSLAIGASLSWGGPRLAGVVELGEFVHWLDTTRLA
jgi:hypothetical protein